MEKEEDAPKEKGSKEAEIVSVSPILESLISYLHLHHLVVMEPIFGGMV